MSTTLEKKPETMYPIHYLLRRRWSPRAYSDEIIDPQKIQSLFEAARWAPSSFNDQPWYFIVATKKNRETYNRLLDCLGEKNQRWAQTAPVLMLSVARLRFAKNDKPNRHALHDAGLAMQSLILQATSLNIYAHQMAGFDVEQARRAFNIPEGFEPVSAVALGYRGSGSELPEGLEERDVEKRSRKKLQEFVFTDTWGKPYPPVASGEL